MIYLRSRLDIADNSGAKEASYIRVVGRQNKKYAEVGDIVTVSIKEVIPDAAVKKGEVAKGVVVRTKKAIKRKDGSTLKFDNNAIVLIDNQKNPRGTRIFGPVARELRNNNFMKIISLAPEVI